MLLWNSFFIYKLSWWICSDLGMAVLMGSSSCAWKLIHRNKRKEVYVLPESFCQPQPPLLQLCLHLGDLCGYTEPLQNQQGSVWVQGSTRTNSIAESELKPCKAAMTREFYCSRSECKSTQINPNKVCCLGIGALSTVPKTIPPLWCTTNVRVQKHTTVNQNTDLLHCYCPHNRL